MTALVSGLRAHLRVLRSSEHGMAMPVAMFATIASLGLAGAAAMSSVDVQRGTKRDSDSKQAIAAADAGANVARMRLARFQTGLSETTPCVGPDGEPQTPVGGWCPATPPEEVGGAIYTYQFSAVGSSDCGGFELCVVATGTADEVSRRVLITFDDDGEPGSGSEGSESEEGEESEEEGSSGIEGLIGLNDVEIENNADVRVGVGTNGNVLVHNNANVCGNIRHGVGKKATFENNSTQCSGYTVTEGNVSLPPVSSFMPANIATSNSNYRLVECVSTDNPQGCQSDTYTDDWEDDEPWEPDDRVLSTSNNETLTLGGGDYFICELELSNNSHLIMAEGARVRIFFDTPENCGLSSGTKQLDVSNNANITSTGYQASLGKFDMPGFYLTGSTTRSTRVEWKNNSGTNELVLYAPNSDIDLKNNATFYGIIVGKNVHLSNNVIVKHDDGFAPPSELTPWLGGGVGEEGEEEVESGGPVYYTAQHYVECTGAAVSVPSENC